VTSKRRKDVEDWLLTWQDRLTVTVPEGELDGLAVKRFTVTGNERVSLQYALEGRGCAPGTYTKLVDYAATRPSGASGVVWMSDTTAERLDHAAPLSRLSLPSTRRVLINGLGLGMIVQAALSFSHVERVDVVEADERVIKLVGPHYTRDERVVLHHADAYAQAGAWPEGAHWDVVWSDIWPMIDSANLKKMTELIHSYGGRCGWHGCWAQREAEALA
jgi:hypothetical protein